MKDNKKYEWFITDPDTNQQYQVIEEGEKYLFQEDRVINPETGETEVFEKLMNINNYDWFDKVAACKTFGYSAKEVDKWIAEGVETELILECLFELEN